MKVEWVKYEDQFQVGICFSIHSHHHRHCHLWIDLGFGCVDFTFGDGY